MTTDTTNLPYTWVLWYHDPNNNDYSLDSYIKIGTVTNTDEFWTLIEAIPQDAWESGMFFFMRDGYRPLWDAPENSKGGAWSKKVDAAETYNVFIDCMVHCAANLFLTKYSEAIVGATISPKGQFHIIKIWNTTTAVCDRKLFNPSLLIKNTDDIAFKAHMLRPK